MEEKLNNKNLIVRLPIDMHTIIKALAAQKNVTLSRYVRSALMEAIRKDKKYGL